MMMATARAIAHDQAGGFAKEHNNKLFGTGLRWKPEIPNNSSGFNWEDRAMKASNSRRFVFVLAVLLLATAGTPTFAAWFEWFEIAPVQPPHPTTCNEVTITISGLWPDSCVPDDSQITVIGHDIYFDAFHHIWLDMGCFHVLTDWFLTESVGPLPAGHYTVHVTLYEYPEGEDPYPLENGVTEFDVVVGARPIGDLDRNCRVNWADFSIFADHWLETGCQYPAWCNGTDLDRSGCVGWGDFSVFVGHLGETGCSEPDWCGGTDFDHSGQVDQADMEIFEQHYGQCGCDVSKGCDGTDLDASGTVDWSDFGVFAAHWAECAGVGCD